MNSVKRLIRNAIPQPVRRGFKHIFHSYFKKSILWEYVPEGWSAEQRDPDIKGWNVQSVLETYKAGWPLFLKHINSTQPLGFWYETLDQGNSNTIPHNIHITYGYALMYAARMQQRISMLDWGGAIGQYYQMSKALVPDLEIDYHCKELPIFTAYTKTVFPEAHFYADDSCFNRTYDFVFASGALHYVSDWKSVVRKLAQATKGYLYLARVPSLQQVPSFVFVQRTYNTSYNTEYLGWCINRDELLEFALQLDLTLVREFIMGENPDIERAPEQTEYRGFLFRSSSKSA